MKYKIIYQYKAKDGRIFSEERNCEIYEKYYPLSIYDILKDYCYFMDEESIEDFKQNKSKLFAYLIIHTRIPQDKIKYCNMISEKDNPLPNLSEYDSTPHLFFNDWSSAMDGSYGRNGWIDLGSKNYCIEKFKYYKNLLEIFNKTIDK